MITASICAKRKVTLNAEGHTSRRPKSLYTKHLRVPCGHRPPNLSDVEVIFGADVDFDALRSTNWSVEEISALVTNWTRKGELRYVYGTTAGTPMA